VVISLLDVVVVNYVVVVSVTGVMLGSDVKVLVLFLNVSLNVFWVRRKWK
jgi:hypothetical protein